MGIRDRRSDRRRDHDASTRLVRALSTEALKDRRGDLSGTRARHGITQLSAREKSHVQASEPYGSSNGAVYACCSGTIAFRRWAGSTNAIALATPRREGFSYRRDVRRPIVHHF